MKQASIFFLLISAVLCLVGTTAFAPNANVAKAFVVSGRCVSKTSMNMVFDEKERKALTRDTEPEDFFATNTDKMSDEEKIPIALAGLAGISLPFILGLIALYAAK